jgi:hypothetical protein
MYNEPTDFSANGKGLHRCLCCHVLPPAESSVSILALMPLTKQSALDLLRILAVNSAHCWHLG